MPDGYTVLEGTPLGHRRSVGVVVSRFNGGLTNRMLAARARGARRGRRRAGRDHGRAGARRVRAAARRDGAREDAPLRVHRRARRDRARRDAALRLRRRRVRLGPPARRRSRPASRSPSACSPSRHVEQARGADRQGRRRGPHRRSRWPTSSPSCARAPAPEQLELATLPPADVARSAQSAGRSPGSGTTARTRWSPRSAGSTRTSSASACSLNGSPTRAYVCTRCLKGGKVTKAV